MPALSTNESSDEESATRRRFVLAGGSGTDDGPPSPTEDVEPAETEHRLDRRSIVIASGIAVLAVLVLILAAGFSGGTGQVRPADEKAAFSLREQIKTVSGQAEALPGNKDAERGLSRAYEQAEQVERLQNDYRSLTPQAAAEGGRLPSERSAGMRRNLVPLFVPSEDASAVEPWYLMARDKDADLGVGTPESFESDFQWEAQVPATVTDDGTIPVVWLAREKSGADGEDRRILAWSTAEFDLDRQVFFDVETGTTTPGEALALEVKS